MTMSATVSIPRFRAFISYSHQDELWAQWLHKSLESYRVPRKLIGQTTAAGVIPERLAPIFRDRDELPSATDLNRKVNEALNESANLIVVCSPRSATSRWVNEEVLAFKRLGRADRIFCLIVDGEPNATELPGRSAEECFGSALRFEIGADGQLNQQRTEPIAADARVGKDGKANAKLKLIAGMLDVGFDTLKQRELHRRNRRMAAITALAVAVMLVTTALAITAVIARGDAERRQKQAEELVNFMLGDLNDKLSEVHRLDILQVVDDKAMAYFASLPTKDVTDAALAQRVTALEKIGGVRLDQGQAPAALEAYMAASTLAGERVQRAPSDPEKQASYADSLKWVGQAYWYRGDLDDALAKFQEATKILQTLAAAKPDDNELLFKLAAARNNSGHVLEARGDFAATAEEYEAVLKLRESLSSRDPRNVRSRSYLGDAYNNLGKLALARGQIDKAVANYRADQRIKVELAATDTNNHDAQENLLLSNAILGRALGICGETAAAIRYTGEAIASAKSLMAFDATYTDWQEYVGLYSQQLGGLLRQQHRLDEAATADAEAVSMLSALVTKDPTRAEWQQELAQSQIESARLQIARGNPASAEKFVDSALKSLDAAHTKDPSNRGLTLLVTHGHVVRGQLAAARNDTAAARSSWTSARDTIVTVAQAGNDPNFLAALATAQVLLDDQEAAIPLVSKLGAMGYRTPDFDALLAAKGLEYPVNTEVGRRVAESLH